MPRIVVSHPYDANGRPSKQYRVLALSADGTITLGESFEMGRAQPSSIAFTPDGRTGIVPQQDGSLGVFQLDHRGRPHVTHAAFRGPFWASKVLIHPRGDRAWILDTEWAVHGGGIYAVRIGPDGTLEPERRVVEAKLPYAVAWLPGPEHLALVASYAVLGSPDRPALHLLATGHEPHRLASSDLFGGGEAIIASMAVTSDGRYALLGDNNEFSGIPNRIVVVALDKDPLATVQAFTPVLDPSALVASPWGGPVLVVSGFGNAIFILDYDADNAVAPFSWRGELAYRGDPPGLPSIAACVEQGPLRGRVLIGESGGIRQLDFLHAPRGVVDRGLFPLESGVGALGIAASPRQP